MSKFQLTIIGATVAELMASAAEFAGYHGTVGGSVQVMPTKTDFGVVGQQAPADDQDDDNAAPDANAPATDSTGLPHDERIHAKDKQRNGDGTWRMRRNVVKTLGQPEIDRITSELRKQSSIGVAPQPPALTAPMSMPTPMQAGVNAAHGIPPAPATTLAPMVAPMQMAAPAAPQPAGMQFGEFMPKFSAALQAGKFTQADLPGFYQPWGISDIGQLSADPARILQFHDWLAAAGRI